jgi:biotin transport system ATP-binding protein
MDRKTASTKAALYLAENGFSDRASCPVHALSEGQKQWLCIHAVLVTEPDIIVFDEPFSSLDLVNRYRLMQWISVLPQQVFLISHDLDALAEFDRVLWLEDGQVFLDGRPEDVLPAYRERARHSAEAVRF